MADAQRPATGGEQDGRAGVSLTVDTARALLDLLVKADHAGVYGKCKDNALPNGWCAVCTALEALQTATLEAELAASAPPRVADGVDLADLIDLAADAIRAVHDERRHYDCCVQEGRFARAAIEAVLPALTGREVTS